MYIARAGRAIFRHDVTKHVRPAEERHEAIRSRAVNDSRRAVASVMTRTVDWKISIGFVDASATGEHTALGGYGRPKENAHWNVRW